MVISRLKGGLGNQMFQYAIGRYLSHKNKVSLKLDFTIGPDSDMKRSYELHNWNIKGSLANKYEVRLFKARQKLLIWLDKKFGKTEREFTKNLVVIERGSEFDPEILKLSGDVYINGFWQSYKYFLEIDDIIKEDFTVVIPPSDYNKEMLSKIQNSNAIALHVRRGDYLKQVHAEHHGVSPIEYYQKSVELIKQKVENPHFFFFSDEPDWAKENIKTGCPTEVSYNPVELGYEDVRLMYNCKHFIVANSTFSWWGAYLSKNKDKIICAPKQWFASKDMSDKDLVPENWIRI
jgi:hypothetical protein